MLLADADVAEKRFRARIGGPAIEDSAAGYARLIAALEDRQVVRIPSSDLDGPYRQLLTLLHPFCEGDG